MGATSSRNASHAILENITNTLLRMFRRGKSLKRTEDIIYKRRRKDDSNSRILNNLIEEGIVDKLPEKKSDRINPWWRISSRQKLPWEGKNNLIGKEKICSLDLLGRSLWDCTNNSTLDRNAKSRNKINSNPYH